MAGRRDGLWTIAVTGVGALCQLLQLAVAARYLSAVDFGVLAIVNVTLWIVLAVQDMGLSSYCVHLGETDRRSQSTLFWISSALGSVAGAVVILVMPFLVWFYGMPELTSLLPWVALNFVLLGVATQYQANLVRVFKAKLLAQIELAARLLSFAIAMWALVIMKLGVMSIVLATALFALIKLVGLIIAAERHWHPQLSFDRSLALKALRYGGYQLAAQLVNQLRNQADLLIVGKALGAEALGLYSLAKELISYPLRFMMPLISRLTLPALARDRTNDATLMRTFLSSLKRTTLASTLVQILLAVFAPWLVVILYGERFVMVAPLVVLLSLFGALRLLATNVGVLAQALGFTNKELRWQVVATAISLPPLLVLPLLVPTLNAFAIALSVLQVILTVATYPFFVRPLLNVRWLDYFRCWWWPSLVCALTMLLSQWVSLPPWSSLSLSINLGNG